MLFTQTQGQGPNIVLLHGWGVHSGIWEFLISKLARNFCVTSIDLPGFGRSETVSDYSVGHIVERLLDVIPQEAIWIGWSLGGLIATKMAILHPHKVTKLICIASSPRFIRDTHWPGVDISLLKKFAEQLACDYEATLMRFLMLQFYGTTINKAMLRWLQQNLFIYGKPNLETLHSGLDLLETLDLRHELQYVQCPMLYVLGRLDTLVPVQVGEILPQISTKIQTVIFPKASHALFLSHELEFLTEIQRFLL